MSELIEAFERMANTMATTFDELTPDSVRLAVASIRAIPQFQSIDDETAEKVAKRIEHRHSISMGLGHVLTGANSEHHPWLEAAKSHLDFYYWERYSEYLERKGFSQQVVASIDNVTDRTLGLLENPDKTGPWDRRGMVVGHVQSGKTANYIGLVTKAADAGYKLIVIIAGIHNHLRNQTQIRVDEGFIGRDSARLLNQKDSKYVGVGLQDKSRFPVPFTNSLKDFNKAAATNVGISLHTLNEPAVFVIKKNANTLKNLTEWLKEYSARGNRTTIDLPMLLIDDEADNASINTSRRPNEASRINGLIRDLLKVFERSAYVGYTATPFANIFIDPDTDDAMLGDDLFPRDFIISLDPPTNYFGPEKVFGDDSLDVVRFIEDAEDVIPLRHKIDHQIVHLPESLCTAVRTFIVARAIRIARGHENFHSSMLVNASRFTSVQSQLRNEIHAFLRTIQTSIKAYGGLQHTQALKYPEIAAMYQVWDKEYKGTGVAWEALYPHLHEAAAPVVVTEVNSRSSGALNYADHPHGLNVIAVGGFSLSRGLTLEGLMISYFHRNSVMYDTLMQMGRWFGYRPDYEDLCRIWMHEDAVGWYAHITDSMEQLRSEIRQMESVGGTPADFGLKVRSHPDTLLITARNKMGSSEEVVRSVGLERTFVETAVLAHDPRVHAHNVHVASTLICNLQERCSTPKEMSGGYFFRDVPLRYVVQFLRDFSNSKASMSNDPRLVIPYIDGRIEELGQWDVFFPSLQNPEPTGLRITIGGLNINCQRRKPGDKSAIGKALFIGNRQRVASRGIERIGLSEDQVQRAHQMYLDDHPEKVASSANFPDRYYREVRDRPLLVVHLLGIGDERDDLRAAAPVVAWSISFPRTRKPEEKIAFRVTRQWIRENLEIDEDEELLNESA